MIVHRDIEQLKEAANKSLSYNPYTGVFIWKEPSKFHREKQGKVAGFLHENGYWKIKLLGKHRQAHRIAWLMTHDELPQFIDHINRNRSDNRLINLRPATSTENVRNHGRKFNRSGLPLGVRFNNGKYAARITLNKKQIFLGNFATPDQAEGVYTEARQRLFGEFCPV